MLGRPEQQTTSEERQAGSNVLTAETDPLSRRTEYTYRFAVSRVTIRRALGVLERAGLGSRQRGRGTIVNPSKIIRQLSPMRPFEEDLRAQGVSFVPAPAAGRVSAPESAGRASP